MLHLQGTASDFDHDFADDWPVRVHDTDPDVHTDARPFWRLPLHGYLAISRHAVLRSPPSFVHANKIPARSHLLKKGEISPHFMTRLCNQDTTLRQLFS